MKLSQERQGEMFILLGAILWGLFPVITILSYNKLAPLVSLGGSTLFATIFFAIVLSARKKWHELKNKSALKDILFVTFFTGILYYLLYFFGLRYTSAGNGSIVALTEVFFSYLLFHVWRKDYIPSQHITGAILMVSGAIIVLYPNIHSFQGGDLLILSAAFIAPFGNLFAQKAREKVSAETIMFVRSFITAIVVFLLAFIFNTTFSYPDLKQSFFFLLINGIFLFGFTKILWIEGIHRLSVTKANALSSMSPILTLFFAWIFLRNLPTLWQLLSFIPMFFGIILLGKKRNNDATEVSQLSS